MERGQNGCLSECVSYSYFGQPSPRVPYNNGRMLPTQRYTILPCYCLEGCASRPSDIAMLSKPLPQSDLH